MRLSPVISLEGHSFDHITVWVEDEGPCEACGDPTGPYISAVDTRTREELVAATSAEWVDAVGLDHVHTICIPCTFDQLIQVGREVELEELNKQAMLALGAITGQDPSAIADSDAPVDIGQYL